MNALRHHAFEFVQPLLNFWLRFWFTPGDAVVLGVLRWFVGGMLVYTHFVWGLNLHAFFGPDGWHSLEAIESLQDGQYIFSFWYLVPTDWMGTAHVVCLVVLAMFTIGLATPVTSVLSLAITISYCFRAQIANYGLDQINGMLLFYLMIGGAGAKLSVDSWIRSKFTNGQSRGDSRKSMRAGLAIRLIQFHYCVIYFFAGTSKLQGDTWWTGEAVWLTLANYDYQTVDMTWLAQYPWFLNLTTHATVFWELSFAFLIWNRHLRPWILLIGISMHLGIGAFLGMWTFGLIMIFGYLAFVPASVLNRLLGVFRSRRKVAMTAASKPIRKVAST